MATLDWPSSFAFAPRKVDGVSLSLSVPKSGFQAFYTGDLQTVSHGADRLRLTLQLPPCSPADAAQREAFVNELVSAGHWVRLHHFLRPEPLGTLRGSLTLQSAVAPGAMSVSVLGAAPAATLLGGDMLASTGQLLPVAYAGAVASGAGQITVPLQRPVQRALSAGAAVQWQRASGLFQLVSAEVAFSYGSGGWQRPVTLPFREVFA